MASMTNRFKVSEYSKDLSSKKTRHFAFRVNGIIDLESTHSYRYLAKMGLYGTEYKLFIYININRFFCRVCCIDKP